MTQNDLLAAREALPKELQFALATSVLDRLAAEGPSNEWRKFGLDLLRRITHWSLTVPDCETYWLEIFQR